MKKTFLFLKNSCLSFFYFLFSFSSLIAENPIKWVVYYSDKAPFETLKDYSLLIFDSVHHPDIQIFLENGKTVLGYLSLGEIASSDPNFSLLEKEGLLLEVNKNWPDSRMIDIRHPLWTKLVIESLIPQILFQRFSGIFLDTVDNAIYLEEKDPKNYQGMKTAMINLIKTIRMHYPQIKIMMNRGFEILPETARLLDYELAESILVHAEPLNKIYKKATEEDYLKAVKLLKNAQRLNPKLIVFTLDYWPLQDLAGLRHIYTIQRKQGFHPYVSTLELDQVVQEP